MAPCLFASVLLESPSQHLQIPEQALEARRRQLAEREGAEEALRGLKGLLKSTSARRKSMMLA